MDARATVEYSEQDSMHAGGIQSLPKINFPGGCLLGCSAGLMNVPRIKGTHTAMKSGILAADAAFREIMLSDEGSQAALHMNGYARLLEGSWIHHELTQACVRVCTTQLQAAPAQLVLSLITTRFVYWVMMSLFEPTVCPAPCHCMCVHIEMQHTYEICIICPHMRIASI